MLLPNLQESVLRLLSRHERYGLEIIQGIRLVTCEKKLAGQGTIYPLFRKLEKQGLIEGRWGPEEERVTARRRYYKITEKGKQELSTLDKIHRDLAKFKYVKRQIDSVNNQLRGLFKQRNRKRGETLISTQISGAKN